MAELRTRAIAWAEHRLPALTRLKRREALPVRLDRRRIYVLPTGFGLLFGLLLFVMMVGALNYGNNVAVLLTCVLAAAAGASLFVAFREMSGLELVALRADEVEAGSSRRVHLRFDPGARTRSGLRVRHAGGEIAFDLTAGKPADIAVELEPAARGWQPVGRLRVWTDHPLGLFQCWSWVNPEREFLVFPALERPAPPLPAGSGRIGEQAEAGASEEHAGLREYRPGDAPRLIAWKASVRHDNLLVRDVEHRSGEALELAWRGLRGLDGEARIRRLAAWVVEADRAQRSYSLALPEATIGPALGSVHRDACLRTLATLPTMTA